MNDTQTELEALRKRVADLEGRLAYLEARIASLEARQPEAWRNPPTVAPFWHYGPIEVRQGTGDPPIAPPGTTWAKR